MHSVSARGPSRVAWHRFVFRRWEAASRGCSSSFHVSDVTAKRCTHFGFCLRNVDVRLELSTEALLFLAFSALYSWAWLSAGRWLLSPVSSWKGLRALDRVAAELLSRKKSRLSTSSSTSTAASLARWSLAHEVIVIEPCERLTHTSERFLLAGGFQESLHRRSALPGLLLPPWRNMDIWNFHLFWNPRGMGTSPACLVLSFHVFVRTKQKTYGSAIASLSLPRSGQDPLAMFADGFSSRVWSGGRSW